MGVVRRRQIKASTRVAGKVLGPNNKGKKTHHNPFTVTQRIVAQKRIGGGVARKEGTSKQRGKICAFRCKKTGLLTLEHQGGAR